MRDRLRWDAAALAALVVLAASPVLTNRFLPLFDYPAHLTVPAVLRHRADAATHVAELYDLHLGLVPNSAHYAWTWILSFVMPLELASRLFVALFSVAALPVAMAFALRTFGRDWRLAVLVVPLTWGRHFTFGFVGFCAAQSLSLVALSLLQREFEHPAARRRVALAAVFALLPFVHFFVMLTTVGLGAVLALAHLGARPFRQVLRSALPMVTGALVMAPWVVQRLGAPASPEVASAPLHAARPSLRSYARILPRWFLDMYEGPVDDVVAALMVLTLAALTAYGHRVSKDDAAPDRAKRHAPLALAAALALAYVALPFEIHRPFHWWAMNVRMVPPLFLWLVIATPPGALDRVGRWMLAPIAIATALYLGYIHVDLRDTFGGAWGTAGLAEVLAHVPKGATVAGLYTDYRAPLHYRQYPFHYVACYAVVQGAALATPFEAIPQAWTNPRVIPSHPFAGDAAHFRFETHGASATHFLVRTCRGAGCVPDPLAGRPEVRLLIERGRWRLYRRGP